MVPPSHGEWLANHFESMPDVKASIRSEDTGLGHFTYLPSLGSACHTSEQTMPQTLLDLCAADRESAHQPSGVDPPALQARGHGFESRQLHQSAT